MGERLPCTQEVIGSIPFTSTIWPDSALKLGEIGVSGAGSWEQETAEVLPRGRDGSSTAPRRRADSVWKRSVH